MVSVPGGKAERAMRILVSNGRIIDPSRGVDVTGGVLIEDGRIKASGEKVSAAFVQADTIVDVVEPFLLKNGFLKRTSRGREATAFAYEHLGAPLVLKTKSQDLFSSKK